MSNGSNVIFTYINTRMTSKLLIKILSKKKIAKMISKKSIICIYTYH